MRVVVADDVMLTRAGITRLLVEAGVDVVGEAADAENLLLEVAAKRPDIALIDIRMPPTHTDEGLIAAQAIRTQHPDVGVAKDIMSLAHSAGEGYLNFVIYRVRARFGAGRGSEPRR